MGWLNKRGSLIGVSITHCDDEPIIPFVWLFKIEQIAIECSQEVIYVEPTSLVIEGEYVVLDWFIVSGDDSLYFPTSRSNSLTEHTPVYITGVLQTVLNIDYVSGQLA